MLHFRAAVAYEIYRTSLVLIEERSTLQKAACENDCFCPEI